MSERPSFVPIWLACKACEHAWDDWQPMGVPVEAWAAHVETYNCPRCGGGIDGLRLRWEPMEEPG
jgi:hypothetical protein